jgi:hypothetical protein
MLVLARSCQVFDVILLDPRIASDFEKSWDFINRLYQNLYDLVMEINLHSTEIQNNVFNCNAKYLFFSIE